MKKLSVFLITLGLIFTWMSVAFACGGDNPCPPPCNINNNIHNKAIATATATANAQSNSSSTSSATGGTATVGNITQNVTVVTDSKPVTVAASAPAPAVDKRLFRQFPMVSLPDPPPFNSYSGPNVVGYNVIEDWSLLPRNVYHAAAILMDPNDIPTIFRRLVPVDPMFRMGTSCKHYVEKPKKGYVIGFTFAKTESTSVDLYGAVAKDCMRSGADGFYVIRKTIEWQNESVTKATGFSAMMSFIFGSSGTSGGGFGINGNIQKGTANIHTYPGVIVVHIWMPPDDTIAGYTGQSYVGKEDGLANKVNDPLKFEPLKFE